MQSHEIYETWAPPHVVWSKWAKPVLFASLKAKPPERPGPIAEVERINTDWVPRERENVPIIIDLPGEEAVWHALAVAGRGYRPVPLYNTSHGGPLPALDLQSLMSAMLLATSAIRALRLHDDSPPAFMLDSRRIDRRGNKPGPGRFDNRWIVFPQDFPSASHLKSLGVREVIVLQGDARQPGDDLRHVLLRWQEAGIAIMVKNANDSSRPEPITIRKPSGFRMMWYRALAMAGFRRNSAGGFGSIVPEESSGGGGFA